MNLIVSISNSIFQHQDRVAFVINEQQYTYKNLAESISGIRKEIQEIVDENEEHIGVVANDDIETYASIFAIWMEGKSFVPLDVESPKERNQNIIDQTKIRTIIDSSDSLVFDTSYKLVKSKGLREESLNLKPVEVGSESIAYILFTSGTTGVPKGVPITFGNLVAFCDAFFALGIELTEQDRCLQMFGLSFDVSVMSYMLPVLKGARVYTIPKDEIKFSYIFELIQDEKLTYTLMVPSIIHYLRPYFEEIEAPDMKYSLFCGEGLPLDVTEEWVNCVPNAKVMNVYGPTECTMLCTGYTLDKNNRKAYNGIVSIGKPFKRVQTIVVDESNQILPYGEKGELCLAGDLLTSGYWNNPKKNEEAFFIMDYEDKLTRFYKTGDLAIIDQEGDIMFLGRIDFQAKVQGGYRVELSEVELYAKEGLDKINVAAIAYTNRVGSTEIGLVIESEDFDLTNLSDYMKSKMPAYMIPSQIKFMESFPLNVNGKIDRNKLKELFN